MKNIHDILKNFGLEVPEDKKADFDKAWKENYRTKAEYEKATSQRDEYKTSLDTVNEKLKEFDGVDVADLRGRSKRLRAISRNRQMIMQRKKLIVHLLTLWTKQLQQQEDAMQRLFVGCLILRL